MAWSGAFRLPTGTGVISPPTAGEMTCTLTPLFTCVVIVAGDNAPVAVGGDVELTVAAPTLLMIILAIVRRVLSPIFYILCTTPLSKRKLADM